MNRRRIDGFFRFTAPPPARSLMGEGVDIAVADLLLAHGKVSSLSSVGAIYQKFQWLDERRDALERWTGFLAQ